MIRFLPALSSDPALVMSESCETVVDAKGLEGTRPKLTAFIVCLGCVVVLLDVSIVNVALQRISDGLAAYLKSLGGTIHTGHRIESIDDGFLQRFVDK